MSLCNTSWKAFVRVLDILPPTKYPLPLFKNSKINISTFTCKCKLPKQESASFFPHQSTHNSANWHLYVMLLQSNNVNNAIDKGRNLLKELNLK